MSIKVGDMVLPGDVVEKLESSKGVTVLGDGLRQNDEKLNTVCVTHTGVLSFKAPNTYWIEGKRKHYIPKRGDLVVGIVVKKGGDSLKVDIGSAEYASLSLFAFEGATKKQKPDLQVGDCIYAKLLNAHREMEPELVCIDSYYKSGKLGILSNKGFIMNISLNLAQSVLDIKNPLLRSLGKKFPYEIALGVNGKMWINCKNTKDFLTVIKTFELAEKETHKTIIETCRNN